MTDKERIVVTHGAIGNHPCLIVDGDSLHKALGIKADISEWLQRRCREYGFEEGRDYELPPVIAVDQSDGVEKRVREQSYTLSFSMAITLCMAKETVRGKIACQALKNSAQSKRVRKNAIVSPYAELRRWASTVHAHLRKAGEASRKFGCTSAELSCLSGLGKTGLPEYRTLLQKLDKSNELTFQALDDMAEGIVRNLEAMRILVEDLM